MFTIKINNKPIILIDCSYYIFYRYFATKKWISFQKGDKVYDFLTCFEKHFENDMIKLAKRFKTVRENIYFGVDCYRDSIWRNEYLNCYKEKRINNPEFDRDIFDYFKQTIKLKYNLNLISGEKLEADDVIALLHKQLNNNEIIIITNDNDYVQLKDNNTKIMNMQFKDITINCKTHNFVIHKALIGDKSDNIKRVGKITKNQAEILITKPIKDINNWLEDNNLLEEFNNNLKLIDFNLIPEELCKNFLETVELIY